MRGAEHFAEAERLLNGPNFNGPGRDEARVDNLMAAAVHATLALASITAEQIAMAHGQDVTGYGR